MVGFLVFVNQLLIGFGDPRNKDLSFLIAGHEAPDVIMIQPCYTHPERLGESNTGG